MTDAADALDDVLGLSGWLTEDIDAYARDWLGRGGQPLLGVARPSSTDQVAATLRIAHRFGLDVIPQGGNTSLCRGTVADRPGALVISLERMNRIVAIDLDNATATVEAGVVLAALHERLNGTDLQFPLHLGAEGSATIGGLVATNAGGSHAARHGMMADRVLGLDVVLADGRRWDGLRATQKDNAGLALRRVFCGAEGTLGIVTQAVLRLAPATPHRATALLSVATLADAVALGTVLRRTVGDLIDSIEFFTETGLALALQHVDGLVWPLEQRGGAHVLVELACVSAAVPLDDLLEQVLAEAFESGAMLDGAVAANEQQRAAFWRLREELPEGQRREGLQLKHDIAVPVGSIGTLIDAAVPALQALCPGVRINPFGHLADGNVHLNLSPPSGHADFGGAETALSDAVYRLAHAAGGSIAAEHGLGRQKVGIADRLRDPVERALMADIKRALDPTGRLNPGVIVAGEPPPAAPRSGQ